MADPLAARADTLVMSGFRSSWTLSEDGEGGETIEDSLTGRVTCAGGRCEAADGTVTTARGLLGAAAPSTAAEAAVGRRGGFDTVSARGSFEVTEAPSGLELTVSPEVRSYGFWGAHGYAALAFGEGRITAELDGTSYGGDFSLVQAWAAGDAAGTNPAGTGGATWTGIVEASPTGTFVRLTGTATVTIADLSRPRVGVVIEVPGHEIGAPGWADMPLAHGRFAAGTAGRDYLEGNFHGPKHEEAWGMFDTTGHVGAFGAKRRP